MEKMKLQLFYDLGSRLNPITKFKYESDKKFEVLIESIIVRGILIDLLRLYPSLNVCRDAVIRLNKSIDEAYEWYKSADQDKRDEKDYSADSKFKKIIENAKEFEIVLSAELQTLAAYHVTQKGIYSTPDLIDQAELILPESVLPKVSEVVKEEIRQSGKCLAFDSGTACAFHILRAVEMVMHEYYIKVCKPNPIPKKRLANWGKYIEKFQNSSKPDIKEVAVLIQQIKDQHRNLIMHPDITLSVDESFALFVIAQGVIITMAAKLPILKNK